MIDNLPLYVTIVFILATLFTLILFYKASNQSKKVLLVSIGWLVLQGVLGFFYFYTNTDGMPPRLVLALFPTFVAMGILFFTAKGKVFIASLNLKVLTWLHVVRIPVELCLYWLFVAKTIPEVMTFEGRNFDILAGITAPIIVYLYFNRKVVSKKILLIWNVACLILLVNIVITALFAAPTPIQQIAFDQPNVGILYFPFVWLPAFIVPVVMFSHFVAIKRLRTSE
ncbi:MAG: hypothetical protein COA58_10930 [Bacteroidetes bacterium]|nr:MAG: hypothetical protein COA58_10930 [Bacteroidota bacterium]